MRFVRFSEDLAINNLVLTLIATGAALVAMAVGIVLAVWLVRRAARATHVDAVESAVERVWRPVRVLATVAAFVIILAACGLLGVSIWREIDLHRWVEESLARFTLRDLWLVGRVVGVLVVVVAGSLYLRRLMQPLIGRAAARLLRIDVLAGQDEVVGKLVAQSRPLLNIFLVYAGVSLAADWLNLPAALDWLVSTVIFVIFVINAARTVVLLVHLATDSLDRIGLGRFDGTRFETYYRNVRGLWPLAKRSFEAVTWLAAATLIVGQFQYLAPIRPYGPKIITLIGIFFLARVVVELSRVLVEEGLTRSTAEEDPEAAKRRLTLVYLVQSLVKYSIYFGAGIMMLYEVGIDPAPFLAGAGIVGLTIGLGAQKLVNDMVSGFFMLFEGQLLTGDFVRINDAEGVVEQVYLRVTKIRDPHGRVHTIRNGNIENVVNYSREWVYAVVDIGVAYEMDLNEVVRVIGVAGQRLREQLPELVLEDTRILGVDALADSSIVFRTVTKVQPGRHLEVERAFRKTVKEAFNEFDIEIPYPREVQIRVDKNMNPIAN